MKHSHRPYAFVCVALVIAVLAPPAARAATAAPEASTHAEAGIAWRQAAGDADVDAAFALARAERKPVFVYWGAKWCPPCNQVKATIFNRQDFIERSRAFVAVYVDGDSPGAQKLGTRFKVRGYPTMVLFNPQGEELTRLPGEVDAAKVTQVLTLGMNAQRPVKQVLAQALAGPRGAAGLTLNDWRLLAFYSWETDEQQLVPKAEVPALLASLADACPAGWREPATRLRLKALAAAGDAGNASAVPAATRTRVLQVLADPSQARTHMDVITNAAPDLVKALAGDAATPAERAALVGNFDSALKRLQADATLSRADRMTALVARVELAKPPLAKGAGKDSPKPPVVLPAALLADVRDATARADREIKDAYERQAVITAAAYLLSQAGLGGESDALLQANLKRSHSPYYLMADLAGNARERGDTAAALRWSEEAFKASVGPATRLQWGASYINMLVDLAPADEARIETAARQLFNEASTQPDAFFERSARSLQRVATKLMAWNAGDAHAAALKRVQVQVDALCQKLPAADGQRAKCDALFKAPGTKAA